MRQSRELVVVFGMKRRHMHSRSAHIRGFVGLIVLTALCGLAWGADKAPPKFQKDTTMDCPAHVVGAKVVLTDIPGGIKVSVTSKEDFDVKRIRTYAAYMVAASNANAGEDALIFPKRTGQRSQFCPIVLADTIITSTDVPGGAELSVKPKDPSKVADLRAKSRKKEKDRLEVVNAVMNAFK
jgi:hypothetical protein